MEKIRVARTKDAATLSRWGPIRINPLHHPLSKDHRIRDESVMDKDSRNGTHSGTWPKVRLTLSREIRKIVDYCIELLDKVRPPFSSQRRVLHAFNLRLERCKLLPAQCSTAQAGNSGDRTV